MDFKLNKCPFGSTTFAFFIWQSVNYVASIILMLVIRCILKPKLN